MYSEYFQQLSRKCSPSSRAREANRLWRGPARRNTRLHAPLVLRPHSICTHVPCAHPAASPVAGDALEALEGDAWEGAGDLPRRPRNMCVIFPSAAIEFHMSR